MKILVVGAGVIGSIYGCVLAAAGNEVTHYVRPGRAPALSGGIPIRLLDGRDEAPVERDVLYRPTFVESLRAADEHDLVLVSVRHYQLDSVLPLLAEHVERADILFFNNVWTNLDAVDRQIPRSRYLWGFPVAGGGFEDGRLEAALLEDVRLGEVDGATTPRLDRIAALFAGARLKPDLQPNILHWQWIHFAIEAGVIGTALKVGSAQAFLDDAKHIEEAILAVRETFEICRARGVDVESYADAAAFFAPAELGAQGIQAFYATNEPARKIMERHNGIDELKRIYLDVLATGDELGIEMPRFRALRPYAEKA